MAAGRGADWEREVRLPCDKVNGESANARANAARLSGVAGLGSGGTVVGGGVPGEWVDVT